MFGKNKQKPKDKSAQDSFNIKTMPDIFYGGKNPELYSEQQPTMKKRALPPASARKISPPARPAPAAKTPEEKRVEMPPTPKKSRLWVYIAFGSGFVVVVAFISFYYINEARPKPPVDRSTPSQPVETTEPPIEQPVETTEPSEETRESVPTSTPALEAEMIDFPPSIFIDSADSDADSLTDMEEEIFGTDPNVWDVDRDGYYDGQEIYNLYSPIDFAPTKLIDSGLVREYINPVWQYRLYYPSNWQIGVVDEQYSRVLFSTLTGDYIEARVVDKDPNETFTAWFGGNAQGQNFSDLNRLENRFKEEGYRREDDLVAYFVTDEKVFVLIYTPGTSGTVPYRHVMRLFYQSFRPAETEVVIPEQAVIVKPPGESQAATGTNATGTQSGL